MNRRNFIVSLFAILPAATQYKRVWKAIEGSAIIQPNPAWVPADYDLTIVYLKSCKDLLERNPFPKDMGEVTRYIYKPGEGIIETIKFK